MRKERQRSHPSHATNPDRRSTSTSNRTQIAPFDFADFACLRLHRDRNPGSHVFDFVDFARLWLCRDRTPGSHVFDFADFAPFDFVDFARLRLCRDGTEMAPIALRSQLRNCWVLMNLTGLDEFFLVGFCFCVYLLRNDIIYLFGSWENVRKCEEQEENVFSILFSTTQPNTWKYFPFSKIAFLENIYFQENILHEQNTALVNLILLELPLSTLANHFYVVIHQQFVVHIHYHYFW